MCEEQKNGSGTIFLAFTLGAAIGGALALLTTPRTGPETQAKLKGMVDETRGKINEMTEDAETRIKKTIREGREILGENADLIKAAIKAGKEAIAAEKAKHEKPA